MQGIGKMVCESVVEKHFTELIERIVYPGCQEGMIYEAGMVYQDPTVYQEV